MQKAQSSDFFDGFEERLKQRIAEVTGWIRDLGFLEAWKKVADSRVHIIFNSLPIITGPTLPDNLKEHAVEELYRVTWYEVCWEMTEEEQREAWREHGDAITEYSRALVERATAKRWKYALANAKQG